MRDEDRRACIRDASRRGKEAFDAGRMEESAAAYEEAVRLLTPSEDDWAVLLYENLGLAYLNLHRARPALQAFLRALDGRLHSREQSLRFLVTCAANDWRIQDARRFLRAYEAQHGLHPDGWSERFRESLESRRRTAGPGEPISGEAPPFQSEDQEP